MKYIETYDEIKQIKPSGVHEVLRSIALSGLSVLDKIKGIEFYLNRPRVQFLYIHHVFKDEEKGLAKLLERLSTNHCFCSYSDAVNKVLTGDIDKPYIALSSDDGFKNNVKAGEILREFGANACFFINPAIIGQTNDQAIKSYCKTRLNLPPVEFLNWSEVGRLQNMGHEIGSHTMEHMNIANSTVEKVIEDCNKTYEIIKERCGEARHFAFPYGRFFHFNESGRKAVFGSGFISCATAERGCHISSGNNMENDELCILRDHIILDWNIDHIMYFISNNSRKASLKNNYFPYKPE